MGLKKRGLGRGLESLLTDVWVKIENPEALHEVGDAAGIAETSDRFAAVHDADPDQVAALSMQLRQERCALLQEAEALKQLLEDFERFEENR